MKHIDDEILRLILECLTSYEYSIDGINKKINDLQNMMNANNELLTYLNKSSMPVDESLKAIMFLLEEEIIEQLIKSYAHLSLWGQA